MRYEELLQRNEWIKKSAEIIQRDAFKCQKCGSIVSIRCPYISVKIFKTWMGYLIDGVLMGFRFLHL